MTKSEHLIDEVRADIIAFLAEIGVRPSGDGRIGEAVCARILGMTPESLANARREGRAPPACRIALGSSRVTYRIRDLCRWIIDRREA